MQLSNHCCRNLFPYLLSWLFPCTVSLERPSLAMCKVAPTNSTPVPITLSCISLVNVTHWNIYAYCIFLFLSASLFRITPIRKFLTARGFHAHLRTTQVSPDILEPSAGSHPEKSSSLRETLVQETEQTLENSWTQNAGSHHISCCVTILPQT